MRLLIDAPNGIPPGVRWGRGPHMIRSGNLTVIFPKGRVFGADHTAPLFTPREGERFIIEQQVRYRGDYQGADRSKCKAGGWGIKYAPGGGGQGCRKGTRARPAVTWRTILRRKRSTPTGMMLSAWYPYLMQWWRKRCGWPKVHKAQTVTVGTGSQWHTERVEVLWNTGDLKDGSLIRSIDGVVVERRLGLRYWMHSGREPRLLLWLNGWRVVSRWPGAATVRIRNLKIWRDDEPTP